MIIKMLMLILCCMGTYYVCTDKLEAKGGAHYAHPVNERWCELDKNTHWQTRLDNCDEEIVNLVYNFIQSKYHPPLQW